MPYASDEQLFPVWREPRSVWEKTGLTGRQQRWLDASLLGLLVLLTVGWIHTAVVAVQRGAMPTVAREIGGSANPLSASARPEATFAMNALLEQFIDWDEVRGVSGQIHVVLQEPGDTLVLPNAVPEEVAVTYAPAGGELVDMAVAPEAAREAPPTQPGIWNVFLRLQGVIRSIPQLSVVTLVPTNRLRGGYLGEYRIGNWPAGEGAYAPPRGFVEVTPENMDTYVSTHFQLKDFLTKGQEGVWPKYVVISPRLLDKLELTIQ
ncbi:MAG TPA: hypothetical protein VMN39_09620, partial [Longimicrobiaceae bacterium]|nr:hypothetical protein [Longimicrobiaceae bacterium]